MTAQSDTQVKAMLDRLCTTGCVVTTAFGEQRDGCYVSFVAPASMQPARLIVMTSHENLTHDLIQLSGVMAIHPLARGQEDWLERFGGRSGRDADKLAGVRWHPGLTGSPLLDDALGYIEGRVLESMDCGDHTARLVEPFVAELRDPAALPLTMFELFAGGLVTPGGGPDPLWRRFAPPG